MIYKSLFCLLLIAASSLYAYSPVRGERQEVRRPSENVRIYNENYYPPNYGYYGNPPVPTPAEAFPDDAEAEYLFEKMHR